MKSEEKTLKYYDQHAREWGEKHHELDQNSRRINEIEKFHSYLKSGKIIEIGSGTGNDASAFNSFGYDYIGTDASRGLLELALERNPGLKFKKVRVQDLASTFGNDKFDGFWCAATLLHLHKNEIVESLKNIHSIVKNNGVGYISVKEGRGEKEDETGRLFSFYSQDEFSKILEDIQFEMSDTEDPIKQKLK